LTRTIFYTATTLDGYLADDQDGLEWLFEQEQDTAGAMNYDTFIAGVGAMTMGATTYAWVRDHLAANDDAWEYTVPCWVFTHRDQPVIADGITLTQDPVQDVHAQMTEAALGKDIWVVGGGDLACQFAQLGLLDELMLSIAPVTLGSGRPLFPHPFNLALIEHAQNGAFLCARFEVVGPR
jgi:dihydrofolate reductase